MGSAMDIEPWKTNGHQKQERLWTSNGQISPRAVPSRTSDQVPSLKHVFSKFAESTSMHGLASINASRRWYEKLVWTLVTLTALAGLTWNLTDLVTSYVSYGKQTDVQLTFANLKFPSVTICNSNAMRESQKSLASAEMQSYLNSIDVDTVVAELSNASETEFFEALSFNFSNVRDLYGNITASAGRLSGTQSNLQTIKQEFNYLFSSHNRTTRVNMGHQLNDLLVSCTFAGIVCNTSSFSVYPTSSYGNCYTLENSEYISYDSGPTEGLALILFLEADEYISTISPGTGAQIQIHDSNTWPEPQAKGIALSAGMDTNVVMRKLQIDRLGDPYGTCDTGEVFHNAYNKKYTREACNSVCLELQVIANCGCYDEEDYEINSNINTGVSGGSITACTTSTEVECMINTELSWQTGILDCSCANPCSETTFLREIHSRMWPSEDYAKLLTQYLCNIKNSTECQRYRAMTLQELSRNFLKVNIYYGDLNFEEIIESPKYEFIQFLADIGGAAGLWIGLSILSFSEVFQLLADLVKYFCQRNQKKKNTQIHVHG